MTVKSAVRVMQLLEYFDSVRREVGVIETARALGIPQSSTAALLKSLVELGYLVQTERRMYLPTPRVTLLGNWIDPMLAPGGSVISMMNELAEATGETIILGIPSGITVRYIYVVPATQPMRLHVGVGDVRPMLVCGLGRLFLAGMSDEEVKQKFFRHTATQASHETPLTLSTVRRDIESIRVNGYSVCMDRVSRGAGVVCMRLPEREQSGPMGVAVGGLSSMIRTNSQDIARKMRNSIARHLGTELDTLRHDAVGSHSVVCLAAATPA